MLHRKSFMTLAGLTAAFHLAPPALAQDTIKIPNIIELSGGGATVGNAWKNGTSLAVDEINAAGGILGKKIQLEFVDTASDPGKARAAIQPTLASRAFCQDYAQAWFECGDYYPLDDCERSFSMWNPAFYDRLTPCEQEATCDGLDACVRGVFGGLHL